VPRPFRPRRRPARALAARPWSRRCDADLSAQQSAALRDLCRPLLAASHQLAAGSAGLGDQVVAILVASGQPDRQRRTAGGGARGPARARAERRLANLRDLVRLARAYEQRAERPTLGDLLADLALDRDACRADPGAVVLSTIHRAKGLEFDHVWLAGAEEGRLPHRRALADGDEREERRLAYVAVTRARSTLHVSWPATAGRREPAPSRYLAGIAG
jgi:DNA helicase-2/ATP-dependent DNA helicase PcrA